MMRLRYVMLALFSLGVPLVAAQMAEAAGPAPITSEQPLRSGTIDILNLAQGRIVIDDAEFRLSDKLTINGRNSASKYGLSKGMRVRFTFTPGNGMSVIDEIWTGQ